MADKIRLTQFATKSGCAAKIGPCDLQAVLMSMPRATGEFARLLETHDDAAVTVVSDDLCLVQTVDFFTPIVDDPYWFGQIAAANALSDIYAMGARPLTAMNLVAWPVDIGLEPLADVLRGGAEKVAEAGAELAGGHSIDDKEPKYGLAVTGVARPGEIVYNGGARPGDKLVLTKRLGMGVLATALKRGLIAEAEMMDAVREAAALNAAASRTMLAVGVHACTDVTGFGLAGHLAEMLDASQAAASGGEQGREQSGEQGVAAVIDLDALPLHEQVLGFIESGTFAHGLRANRDYLLPRFAGLEPSDADLSDAEHSDSRVLALFDPQTSGGLLLAVAEDRHERLTAELATAGAHAYTIGEVVAGPAGSMAVAGRHV
jgi:selenide, water dikinase